MEILSHEHEFMDDSINHMHFDSYDNTMVEQGFMQSHGYSDDNTSINGQLMTNFDPSHSSGHDIVGDPSDSMQDWHQQEHDDTCAVVSQEFVLEELTGQHYTEDQLMHDAESHGWYSEGDGTPMDDVGNLLVEHGFEVEKTTGNSFNDLVDKLEDGDKVIVGVNAEEMWSHVENDSQGHVMESLSGVDTQNPDHAVEVIGIDFTDNHEPMVILNDPGHPDGMGLEVPASEFMDAWHDSNDFMVNTTGHSADSADLNNLGTHDNHNDNIGSNEPSLGGYYNNDGTYHWESDESNTDEDGNIVSYGN